MFEICVILGAWAADIAALRDEGVPRERVSGYYYREAPEGPERDVIIPLIPAIYETQASPDEVQRIMERACMNVLTEIQK